MELDDVRRFYAEEVRAVANVQNEALAEAFARVRREDYLGPGPWQIVTPESWLVRAQGPSGAGVEGYRTMPDADPRHLYHNVLVAIDAARRLNNGQASASCTSAAASATTRPSSPRRSAPRAESPASSSTPSWPRAHAPTSRTCRTWKSSRPTAASTTRASA